MKTLRYVEVPMNATFSPAKGQVGSTSVYRKVGRNGVCPKLGADIKTNDSHAIFYPHDPVVVVELGRGRR